jgi:hypothetical protein
MDVFTAFFHQFEIFIKRTGYFIIKHDLQIGRASCRERVWS